MGVWFPINNPIKPCSVLDKICWYTATTNIKITEIIPFTEKTNVKTRTFLVSMDVESWHKIYSKTRVYLNCLSQSIWKCLQRQPIPTHYLPEMLRLINPRRKFLPLQWKALATKRWNCNGHKDSSFDSFAIIFMTYIETTTISKNVFRTTVWKWYIHDIFSLWDMSKPDIEAFIEQTNLHHPTIEFTAETFDTETAFLDTRLYTKAQDSRKNLSLMQRHILNKRKPPCTHISPRATLQMLRKGLSKEKLWESYEKTPQKQPLRKIIQFV